MSLFHSIALIGFACFLWLSYVWERDYCRRQAADDLQNLRQRVIDEQRAKLATADDPWPLLDLPWLEPREKANDPWEPLS